MPCLRQYPWLLGNAGVQCGVVTVTAQQGPADQVEEIEWSLGQKILVAHCKEHQETWTSPQIVEKGGQFYVTCVHRPGSHLVELSNDVLYLCVVRDGLVEWPQT